MSSDAERLSPGDWIASRYRIERVLAKGAGIVFLARDAERLVVLKCPPPTSPNDTTTLERFMREMGVYRKLRSPHVVRLLDTGFLSEREPYLVFEHLDGCDLDAFLRARRTLPTAFACDAIMQSCHALQEAHSCAIVHRDVKPQNLFHVGGGEVASIRVLDFGMSKLSDATHALTQTGTALGSPLYMAPEQVRSSKTVDARADVWSLGVVLFQLLSGGFPFMGRSLPELVGRILRDPPVPLSRLQGSVPEPLERAVLRCLEKDPAARFSSALELSQAIAPFGTEAGRKTLVRGSQPGMSDFLRGALESKGEK